MFKPASLMLRKFVLANAASMKAVLCKAFGPAESLVLEDVASLVFIEHYMLGFAASKQDYDDVSAAQKLADAGVKYVVGPYNSGVAIPASRAYNDAGADELVFLDITASHERRPIIAEVVERTAAVAFMPAPLLRRAGLPPSFWLRNWSLGGRSLVRQDKDGHEHGRAARVALKALQQSAADRAAGTDHQGAVALRQGIHHGRDLFSAGVKVFDFWRS